MTNDCLKKSRFLKFIDIGTQRRPYISLAAMENPSEEGDDRLTVAVEYVSDNRYPYKRHIIYFCRSLAARFR